MIRTLEQEGGIGKQKKRQTDSRTMDYDMIYGENPKLHQRSRHLTTPLRHDFTTLMTKKNSTTTLRHDFSLFALLMKSSPSLVLVLFPVAPTTHRFGQLGTT